MSGFLYGEPCNEPCRGGKCRRTLGHGGPHRSDGREREVSRDRPEPGKIYMLTGGSGTPAISNGNTWAESEVPE